VVEGGPDAGGFPAAGGRADAPMLDGPAAAQNQLLDLARAAAGIGTFDWDLTTGTLRSDERLLELFGVDAATFDETIEGFNARLHPDDLDRVTALLQHAIDTCGDYEAEYRVVRADGFPRWVAARGRALCDEAGVTVRVLGAAWDVTARRQTQDRVTEVLEDMAVGFIALDADWVVTLVNAEGERIPANGGQHWSGGTSGRRSRPPSAARSRRATDRPPRPVRRLPLPCAGTPRSVGRTGASRGAVMRARRLACVGTPGRATHPAPPRSTREG
jgi:PAS domain S-box-containing protein